MPENQQALALGAGFSLVSCCSKSKAVKILSSQGCKWIPYRERFALQGAPWAYSFESFNLVALDGELVRSAKARLRQYLEIEIP